VYCVKKVVKSIKIYVIFLPNGVGAKKHIVIFSRNGVGAKKHIVIFPLNGVGAKKHIVIFPPNGVGAKKHIVIFLTNGVGAKKHIVIFIPNDVGAKKHIVIFPPNGVGKKKHIVNFLFVNSERKKEEKRTRKSPKGGKRRKGEKFVNKNFYYIYSTLNGNKFPFLWNWHFLNRASGDIMHNRWCSEAEPPVTSATNTSRASDDIIGSD
jgi:hypothetical protein